MSVSLVPVVMLASLRIACRRSSSLWIEVSDLLTAGAVEVGDRVGHVREVGERVRHSSAPVVDQDERDLAESVGDRQRQDTTS